MSFILEALKRSENERQRKIGPSLADVQVRAQRSEKPWWAFAVAGLLLVNLTVLLIVLLRDDAPTAPVPQNTAVQAAATDASPARNPSVAATAPPISRPESRQQRAANEMAAITGDPSVRSLADEAAVGGEGADTYPPENPDLAVAAAVPEGPSIVRQIQSPSLAPSGVRPQPQRQASSEPEEVLPTFRELGGTGANLPDLHLDIHVHSPVPAERFVFVNMRKYIEGQALSEGPLVERINSQGVVLNHRGLRFLLPRQ
jgi:general secretion pathway protein B